MSIFGIQLSKQIIRLYTEEFCHCFEMLSMWTVPFLKIFSIFTMFKFNRIR